MTDFKAQILSRFPRPRRGNSMAQLEDPPPPYSPQAPMEPSRPRPVPPPSAPRPSFDGAGSTSPHGASAVLSVGALSSRQGTEGRSLAARSGLPPGSRRDAGLSSTPRRPPPRASFSGLPLGLLRHIFALTLDPRTTPPGYEVDYDEECARRLWSLFLHLRPVDRRCFLAATSILRERLLAAYCAGLQPGASTRATPPVGNADDPTAEPVFAHRTRESAVFDRFVALYVGESLRRAESAFYEDQGAEVEIFQRLQPAARIEDLLLAEAAATTDTAGGAPLLTPASPPPATPPALAFPLSHTHLAVTLSPLWAQLHLSYAPVAKALLVGYSRVGRSFVVEVRRQRTTEDTVHRILAALAAIRAGVLPWGSRVS